MRTNGASLKKEGGGGMRIQVNYDRARVEELREERER